MIEGVGRFVASGESSRDPHFFRNVAIMDVCRNSALSTVCWVSRVTP